MKKLVSGVLTGIMFLFGCEKNDEIDIRIRVKNSSDVDYVRVQISGDSPSLIYRNIPFGSSSDYQQYDSRIFPSTYFVITTTDTLNFIIDGVTTGSGVQDGLYTISLDKMMTIDFSED